MPDNHPYNTSLRIQHIGPHENANLQISMGEKGPFKVGVFATNGSGKTTLSRQFRLQRLQNDLKDDESPPDAAKFLAIGQGSGLFRFKFDKQGSTVNEQYEVKYKAGEPPRIQNKTDFIFHVFNSDYVRETIEPNNFGPDDTISGYIIGKEAVDVSKEKKDLASYKDRHKHIKDAIDNQLSTATQELDKLAIRSNTKEYKNLNFENLLENSNIPEELETFEALKSKLKKLESIPEDLIDVSEVKEFNQDFEFAKTLSSDLNEIVSVSSISEAFKEKIQNKEEFIKAGLISLEGDSEDICPFCEQDLLEQQLQLIDRYKEYFEDTETKFKQKLKRKKNNFESLLTSLQQKQQEFLKAGKQWEKIRNYFPTHSTETFPELKDPETVIDWEGLYQIIVAKRKSPSEPVDESTMSHVQNLIRELNQYISTELSTSIYEANYLIRKVNLTKTNSSNEILSLKRRICNARFILLQKKTESDCTTLKNLNRSIKETIDAIDRAESKTKHAKRAKISEEFKNLIRYVFHDKYIFNEEENGLEFKSQSLRESAQDILSDGEKSIIAFCYYLAEVHRVVNITSDYDKLFFIIDDPVSSMDFHFTYSISTLLGELESRYDDMSSKENLRLLLLTHNIEFMSVVLRNNVLTRGGYVLTPGAINKLNKELIMPYQEHLMDVYRVAEKGIAPNHTTPNSMRHIIETINKFECPGNNYNLKEFINDNEELKSCSGIHILVQDGSHGYIRDQSAMTPDLIKKGCESIIKFISGRYERQITNIKKSVKNL